ncbi:hypothetical protein ACQ5SO_07465 [Rhodovulum sp. DZ06]|uniref:hypothetical protein n=1 Tax=Rhodovulum sp. DZ06 TaxID=3425126 RepID=UPI003D34A973
MRAPIILSLAALAAGCEVAEQVRGGLAEAAGAVRAVPGAIQAQAAEADAERRAEAMATPGPMQVFDAPAPRTVAAAGRALDTLGLHWTEAAPVGNMGAVRIAFTRRGGMWRAGAGGALLISPLPGGRTAAELRSVSDTQFEIMPLLPGDIAAELFPQIAAQLARP